MRDFLRQQHGLGSLLVVGRFVPRGHGAAEPSHV